MSGTVSLGKVRARVDFDTKEFDRIVLTKGLRCRWRRALDCPCRLNDQTQQPDPSCPLCGAEGFLYVLPSNTKRPTDYDAEDPPFVDTADGAATQVIVQSMTNDPQIFEKLGEWIFGTVRLTPFSWSRLGFRDKLTLIDGVMQYRQTFVVPESRVITVGKNTREKLRYPVVNLHEAYTIENGAPVAHASTMRVEDDGSLTFLELTPATGARISIVYDMHPTLVVMDHTFALRDTLLKFKQTMSGVIGREMVLPLHAMGRLDFIVNP